MRNESLIGPEQALFQVAAPRGAPARRHAARAQAELEQGLTTTAANIGEFLLPPDLVLRAYQRARARRGR